MNEDLLVDQQLEKWALSRGLAFQTFEHWDSRASHAFLADSAGDLYQFWARLEQTKVRAGVGIFKRGNLKPSALRREREKYQYSESAPVELLPQALDSCLDQVRCWIQEIGHVLLSAET